MRAGRSLRHRPARSDHRLVAADEGGDLLVTHALGDVARQRAAIAAAAIQDEFLSSVGEHFLDVAFEHASAEMTRLGGMTVRPLDVFTHVDEDGFGIGGQPGASLLDRDFGDTRANLVDDFQETRRMVHTKDDTTARERVNRELTLNSATDASQFFCKGQTNWDASV